MKQPHVILRSARPSTSDVFRGPAMNPSALEDAAAALRVEVDDIERSALPSITRAGDVLAVAPVIPMKLIEPLDGDPGANPTAAGNAWGVEAVGAHTSPFTGDGIVVAVLDTGIDPTHPAFQGVQLVQQDFTGQGNGDRNGHGTHCAGTIFGRDVNGVRIGVARGVKRALIGKVLAPGAGGSDQVANAIQWAMQNGANVISMSLGIDFPGFVDEMIQRGLPPALATSRALEGYRANVQLFERIAALLSIQSSFMQPAVIVAAAGNESLRGQNPDFEIAVSPPAVSEGIVSVAALAQGTAGFTVALFSNTGANVSGPGVDVLSARAGGGLRSLNGTSMATPHVAGVAALWAEKLRRNGPFNALQLTNRLVGTAVSDGLAQGFDPFDVGAGMVRAPQA
ncbi:MAG TPA: S8 family serine peptidase [Longimicrobium sp.]|nr:S8 family serine peptidase [Longimicrobium sp.]